MQTAILMTQGTPLEELLNRLLCPLKSSLDTSDEFIELERAIACGTIDDLARSATKLMSCLQKAASMGYRQQFWKHIDMKESNYLYRTFHKYLTLVTCCMQSPSPFSETQRLHIFKLHKRALKWVKPWWNYQQPHEGFSARLRCEPCLETSGTVEFPFLLSQLCNAVNQRSLMDIFDNLVKMDFDSVPKDHEQSLILAAAHIWNAYCKFGEARDLFSVCDQRETDYVALSVLCQLLRLIASESAIRHDIVVCMAAVGSRNNHNPCLEHEWLPRSTILHEGSSSQDQAYVSRPTCVDWHYGPVVSQWHSFDDDTARLLEQAWQDFQRSASGAEIAEVVINCGSNSYAVNVCSMTQRNVKSGITRHVRRGSNQSNFNAASTIAKLQEQVQQRDFKIANLEDKLQEKINELNGWVTWHNESSSLRNRLLQSRDAWMNQTLSFEQLSARADLERSTLGLIQLLRPQDHFQGFCVNIDGVSVKEVHHVCNVKLWHRYQCERNTIKGALAGTSFASETIQQLACNERLRTIAELLDLHDGPRCLDRDCNEHLLLHGTYGDIASKIIKQGFDARLCSESALYGHGVYFTTESCKALQYTRGQPGETGWLLVARVTLGDAYFTPGHRVQSLRPPERHASGKLYDSVVAKPGIPKGTGGLQVHWEFVVPDRQAYPELLIKIEF